MPKKKKTKKAKKTKFIKDAKIKPFGKLGEKNQLLLQMKRSQK